MNSLPKMALSIRQPWAWAIVHAGKDIENRDWATKYRGPICIHAAFVEVARHMNRAGEWPETVWVPLPDELSRGGIIGGADIVDCVDHSDSPWFFGKYGFVLENVRPVEFIQVRGALGFFDWKRNLSNV